MTRTMTHTHNKDKSEKTQDTQNQITSAKSTTEFSSVVPTFPTDP